MRQTAAVERATAGLAERKCWTKIAAIHSAGSVAMSPIAVTSGADTESRSQRRSCDKTAIPTDAAPTTIEPSTPPRIEIVTKSATDRVCPVKAVAMTCAAGPRNRHVASVRYHVASAFCPRNPRRLRFGSN
jgi:hypothetical protein